MSGIPKNVVYCVSRIHCTFSDGLGHAREISGTGFWVGNGTTTPVFVTNRHNMDATIWEENPHDLKLVRVCLELRKRGTQSELLDETAFFELVDVASVLRLHPSADCAVLMDAKGVVPAEYRSVTTIDIAMIADGPRLSANAQIMDLVSFVGFPGRTCAWWDDKANLPIARLGALASDPGRPFSNRAIRTDDVGLVSGLSFSGSSGSPLFLHEKGIRVGQGLSGGAYVPPQVIGIMSGHMQDVEPGEELLNHTGLSYFTRSTSILELIGGSSNQAVNLPGAGAPAG
jgi:hypothetical protein